MTKVVYNGCYGGFGLSPRAILRYAEIKGIKLYAFVYEYKNEKTIFTPATEKDLDKGTEFRLSFYTSPDHAKDTYFSHYDIERDDPALVQVVEEMGDKANGSCAKLCIQEIPKGTAYRIDEYDGNESVMTQSSYDWKVAHD